MILLKSKTDLFECIFSRPQGYLFWWAGCLFLIFFCNNNSDKIKNIIFDNISICFKLILEIFYNFHTRKQRRNTFSRKPQNSLKLSFFFWNWCCVSKKIIWLDNMSYIVKFENKTILFVLNFLGDGNAFGTVTVNI